MRKSHIAYTVLVTLAHACMNWQISFLRYLLAVFPIHIASAKIDSEHRRIGTVIALTGGALFLVLCWEMVNGRWAF